MRRRPPRSCSALCPGGRDDFDHPRTRCGNPSRGHFAAHFHSAFHGGVSHHWHDGPRLRDRARYRIHQLTALAQGKGHK